MEKKNFMLYYIKIIKKLFQVDFKYFFFMVVGDLLHALSYIILMMMTEKFFDSISKNKSIREITIYAGFLLLSFLLLQLFNGLMKWPMLYKNPKVLESMYVDIQDKANKIKPIAYENPEFLNMLQKCRSELENGYLSVLLIMKVFTFYFPYFVFITIYLGCISRKLTFLTIVCFVPVVLSQLIKTKMKVRSDEKKVCLERKAEAFEKYLSSRDYFKETRVYGSFNYFYKNLKQTLKKIELLNIKTENRSNVYRSIAECISIAGYVAIILILIINVEKKIIKVSEFAAIIGGIDMMFSIANEVFGSVLNNVSEKISRIIFYLSFINEKKYDKSENKNIEKDKEIILENVSFKYPNCKEYILRNISLTIKPGESIAIVGENGAGKSTLSKILLGIYEPSSGYIKNNIVKSAVFQDYQKYKTTVRDNIIISDNGNINPGKLEFLLDLFPIFKEKNAVDMRLSVEFGGIDLSGGQWQSIALSRGQYKSHEMIVLDEPTSAIDPIEESKIYHQFRNISKNVTSILITHRLGAAKIADKIIVLRNGEICDIGTHYYLLERCDYYKFIYNEQAQWYKI